MHQVLFNIPIFKGWIGPDGIPIYGFGAMLFITFVVCTIWFTRRGAKVGMPPERIQDMAIWMFVSGIIGARVLYMIQYANQFPDKSVWGLIVAFFQIWKGGIIFYGSALGATIGYALFYRYVLRKMNVSTWQLADALAPVLALGLAIGRIGCYLNGCCWGQVAVEEVCPVPLGGAHFPLLPAHTRDSLVRDQHLQTSTGFTLPPRDRTGLSADPRSVVRAVERGSAADQAGMKPGDRIVKVNGQPNEIVVEMTGPNEKVTEAIKLLRDKGVNVVDTDPERPVRAYFKDPDEYEQGVKVVRATVQPINLYETDRLWEVARDWPRGRHDLTLTIERNGEVIELPPFVPRTVGLYPTQLYETVSMILLIFVLIAYYPFRRHDGQLLILCMIGYAVHRFINESIRIEPIIGLGLTLSQWGSVVILALAIGLEAYLWRVMPSRWAAGFVEPPAPPPAAPALPPPPPAPPGSGGKP